MGGSNGSLQPSLPPLGAQVSLNAGRATATCLPHFLVSAEIRSGDGLLSLQGITWILQFREPQTLPKARCQVTCV